MQAGQNVILGYIALGQNVIDKLYSVTFCQHLSMRSHLLDTAPDLYRISPYTHYYSGTRVVLAKCKHINE